MRYAYFIRRLAIIMRHDIFSTPVWHLEGTPQELVDELYQGAYRCKERWPSENRSNQGGYHSPALDWEEFHPQGIKYIEKILNDIHGKFKGTAEVKGWWYNINPKGAWNKPHIHPHSDLALVWYITDSDGLLHLMNPFLQRRNSNNVNVTAKKGDIIIFPSDIIHYVKPNKREEDRVSISMNLQLS